MHLRRIIPLAIFVLAAACGGARTSPPPGPSGAAAPAAAVERFLRLVEAKNYREMGLVFGTKDGNIYRIDPARQVEQRMFAIASILEHESFSIANEEQIPGRFGEAMRMTVNLTSGRQRKQVPFTTVRSGGSWLVEQVDLERITRTEF
ncbi:MAG TPA: hypothetical protein VF647_08415 [Longimicrobium sp.]